MPSKKSLAISITVRPLEGINDEEVGLLSRWVGKLKCVKAAQVVERPGQWDAHCHIGVLYDKLQTPDNVSRRLKILFKKHIANEPRWINPRAAICVRAHDNFIGLVGGYFDKEDGTQVVIMKNISEDECRQGAQLYEEAKKKKQEKGCTRNSLIRVLTEKYHELWQRQNRTGICPTPIDCMNSLIMDGKSDYLYHWQPMKKTIETFWPTLISARKV